MKEIVAVAYTPAAPTDSPNLKASRRTGGTHARFVDLIKVSLLSVHRWNPDVELVVVTTPDAQQRLARDLQSNAIRVLATPFDHRPPPGFYPTFNASLFSIDAINLLCSQFATDDRILLLDPDTLTIRPLGPVFSSIPTDGLLAYDTGFPLTETSQGLTGHDADVLHELISRGATKSEYRHFGGEMYGFTPAIWENLAPLISTAWEFTLDRHRTGEALKLVTEEHLMNYALRNVPIRTANHHIRRIWTAPTYRQTFPSDRDLSIWHLPAEKSRGLRTIARKVDSPRSWFWLAPQNEWTSRVGRICTVTGQTPWRDASDRTRKVGRALQARLSSRAA